MKGLILTYMITICGSCAALINPFYGFLAYVTLALLRPDFMWAHSISGGRFSKIVAIVMLASWVMRGFGNWKLGRARVPVFLFIGYFLWCVLLAFMAPHQKEAWYYVEQMAKILLPFLVGITTCRTERHLKLLAWTIVLCTGYVCFEMNVYYFGGYNFLYLVGFGGVDNNSAAIGFVTGLGVAFFLFLSEDSWVKKAVIGACMAFILHAILFSFSRGAMLATGIGVTISFFITKKKQEHYVLFGIAALAVVLLAGPSVRERFLLTFMKDKRGQREASAQSRIDLWADCWTVFQRDPVFGCGPDHWPLPAHTFGWKKGKEAHSLWVQTATETGLPGIIMFSGFYLMCIWRSWRLLRQIPERAQPWFGHSCRITIAALCGFGVAAQFVSLEALEVPYYVALLGCGNLVLYERLRASGAIAPEDSDWRDEIQPSTPREFGFDAAGPVILN